MKGRLKYLLVVAIFLLACNSLSSVGITPTATATVAPTLPPTRTPITSTPESNCFQSNNVKKSSQGKEICVSGNVYLSISIEGSDANGVTVQWWVVRFSQEPTDFYVVQDVLPFEIQSGDCISVLGKVQLDDNKVPFIENGEITKC